MIMPTLEINLHWTGVWIKRNQEEIWMRLPGIPVGSRTNTCEIGSNIHEIAREISVKLDKKYV